MNTNSCKVAVSDAHSKLILVGEHAVVYGKPAIAIPFPLKASVSIEECHGELLVESGFYSGSIEKVPDKMSGISQCIKETLYLLNKNLEGLCIRICSEIPLGRGLGSSAAIATAVVRSLFSFYGQRPKEEELFYLVQIAETHAHGKPSGIDMNAVASEYPLWFMKGKETEYLIESKPLYIVVADTGRIGDTRTAVDNVRMKYFNEPEKVERSLKEIERIVKSARSALLEGNIKLIGQLLNENQQELMSLGVSDDILDSLIDTARSSGALGAKLTGGGLGGCMLALAGGMEQAEYISKRLMTAGAVKSWYFSTDKNLLYVSQEDDNESNSKSKYKHCID